MEIFVCFILCALFTSCNTHSAFSVIGVFDLHRRVNSSCDTDDVRGVVYLTLIERFLIEDNVTRDVIELLVVDACGERDVAIHGLMNALRRTHNPYIEADDKNTEVNPKSILLGEYNRRVSTASRIAFLHHSHV